MPLRKRAAVERIEGGAHFALFSPKIEVINLKVQVFGRRGEKSGAGSIKD